MSAAADFLRQGARACAAAVATLSDAELSEAGLSEAEKKAMMHFAGVDFDAGPKGTTLFDAGRGGLVERENDFGETVLLDEAAFHARKGMGPPIDICLRAIYGDKVMADASTHGMTELKDTWWNSHGLYFPVAISPHEIWSKEVQFVPIGPSQATPGSRFVVMGVDGRIPCIELSTTMLATNSFTTVLQSPSRVTTIDADDMVASGERSMCFSMGRWQSGLDMNHFDVRVSENTGKYEFKDAACPVAGLNAFHIRAIKHVYENRVEYIGLHTEDEDGKTFARRFQPCVDVEPVTGRAYMRASVSDAMPPKVVAGDAWDPGSTHELPHGFLPESVPFGDMVHCGAATIPIFQALSGIWICGGQFGVKWTLTHAMVLHNGFDARVRKSLVGTVLGEPCSESQLNSLVDRPPKLKGDTRVICNALQRFLMYRTHVHDKGGKCDIPYFECPTDEPKMARASLHLTSDAVVALREARARERELEQRNRELGAKVRRQRERVFRAAAAAKLRDDNEHIRAKHQAVELIERVFRAVAEQERAEREARWARAQSRLARRARAKQFARRAEQERAEASRLRRMEALRGLNAGVAERALATLATPARGELDPRAHHGRRRPAPPVAVAVVDVDARRRKQRRRFERRAARRAERAPAAARPSIEVVVLNFRPSATTDIRTSPPNPNPPPPNPPHINVAPLVDFAQWEADFEADLVDEWNDAVRRGRFREAQPLLRMDELRRIQARWKVEREAQASSLSRAARKHRRNQEKMRQWRDGVRTPDEQLLQARYSDLNRAYGEATTRYKATVEKLTVEKEAARAETAATQKSSYNAQECVVCMDAPRTEVALPCKHFCVCAECAGRIERKCPICNGAVAAWLGVRMA